MRSHWQKTGEGLLAEGDFIRLIWGWVTAAGRKTGQW